MDYESILFGLQPLLNAEELEDLPVQDVYLNSYLTVLDQLAVSLRTPSNRTIVGSSGLLTNLVRVLNCILDTWFHKHDDNKAWPRLASELIRCVANSLVDDDNNRQFYMSNEPLEKRREFLDYYVDQIFKLTDTEDDQLVATLQMRTVVLVKNLCLDNSMYFRRFGQFIRSPLLGLLADTQHTYLHDSDLAILGSELLTDFIENYVEGLSIQDLLFFAQFIQRVSKTIVNQEGQEVEDTNDEEDDPSVEIINYLTQSLEIITKNYDDSKVFYTESHIVSQIQNNLLDSLDHLSPKTFCNKLIVMRRITTAIGYISANTANSNKQERDMCFHIVQNSTNGYTYAAALIILSNSISGREDVNEILQKVSLDQFLTLGPLMIDPIQFQGYLDIAKKLMTLDSAMFLSRDSLLKLSAILKTCHDQSKYFNELSPLIDNLLKKLVTVLPSSSLQKVLQEGPLLEVLTDRDSLLSCLTLDKLLVATTKSLSPVLSKLWTAAFKFQDSAGTAAMENQLNVSVFYLFQLAKTCGIYLRDHPDIKENYVLSNHLVDLRSLLEAIHTLKGKKDRASESAFNNGKFVASMVYKTLENADSLNERQNDLKPLVKSFFD